MDKSTFKPEVVPVPAVGTSRLPAGSTLEIRLGLWVPHPQADPNLPGAGDPRLEGTKAVNEVNVAGKIERHPLDGAVQPKAVTVAGPNPGTATLEVEKAKLADPQSGKPAVEPENPSATVPTAQPAKPAVEVEKPTATA